MLSQASLFLLLLLRTLCTAAHAGGRPDTETANRAQQSLGAESTLLPTAEEFASPW